MLNFGFQFGSPGGAKPPLVQSDYIRYSLDPDTGFLTEPIRKINDEGNIGTYNGTMYSGKGITLSGDGLIEIPTIAESSVTYFNFSTNSFEQSIPTTLEETTCTAEVGQDTSNEVTIIDDTHISIKYLEPSISDPSAVSRRARIFITNGNASCDLLYEQHINITVTSGEIIPTQIEHGDQTCTLTSEGIDEGTLGIGTHNLVYTKSFRNVDPGSYFHFIWDSTSIFEAGFEMYSVPINASISSTYELKDGTYGITCKLHTTQFTQGDLDFFNEMPERMIEWYFGTISIPSGIVRGADDKVYYPIDGYMMELSYSEGSELYIPVAGGGWTDNGDGTFSCDGTTGGLSEVGTEAYPNSLFRCTRDIISVNSGQVTDIYSNDPNALPFVYHDTPIKYSVFKSYISYEDGMSNLLIYSSSFDGTVSNLSMKQVTSEYLPIQGTFTLNDRLAYGIQEMRLEMTSGVPTKVLTNHQIRFRGDGTHVNTGISIDGSLTDFTMMMGFSMPDTTDDNRYIVGPWSSSESNGIYMYGLLGSPDLMSVTIGRYNSSMSFPVADIHAMVAVFNHSTSQLQVAIDGDPLSAPFDIVFDGPTEELVFGTNGGGANNHGYIGEGILSATMESEDAWFTFWDRIQLDECDKNKPAGEYLSNHTFDCGTLGWDFDPAYTAEITDNGDGSLHLKTTSNFGSLVPVKLPTESAEWVCEVKFRNQVGNGKISFRKPNNVWVSTPTLGDGVHSATYTGVIKELHIGADGDNTYEADYEYISIKKVVTEEVTFDGSSVTFDGEEVTWS